MVCGGVATPYHTLPPRKPKSRETDPDGFDWDRHPTHTPSPTFFSQAGSASVAQQHRNAGYRTLHCTTRVAHAAERKC